ncbi:carotenoid oxygenase family protein [Actinoallomurus liliacearum]|uniref:Dioxygenase n=1 Tax=Actinoallomurus liliacearum TaxID=1080073 RepID=A0ABP8TYL3_9ACTN
MNNPFLQGGFAPIRQELTVTDLPVTGTIPGHLDGRYLRNGPNPAGEVDPDTYNWFTGDGMVHGVRIRDGRAEWYRNRWVRTPRVAAALGEAFSARPSSAPLHGMGANTNVIGHAGRTLALVEAGLAIQELTDELDTVGGCDFDGTMPGGYTAHPKRDPETGELHAVSYFFGRGNEVRYSVIDAAGHARRTVDVRVTGSPMMHDFSLTESHVVFYDLPVTFDARQAVEVGVPRFLRAPARLVMSALVGRVRIPDPIIAAAGRRGGSSDRMPYRWNPRYPARIGVMPRSGGAADVRWFEVEPCYVFHPLNAYDDGDTIVLEVVRHTKVFDRDLQGPSEGVPTLARWTVDLGAGKVREEQVDDRAQEFPRVDERLVGRRHRYGYALALDRGITASDTILKHDLVRGTTTRRSFGAGREAGEFVFEPNSPDAAEDDGVLMGFVYDPATDRTDLMLLDAGSLETVAAVHLPTRVPAGFHGNWVPTR